MVKHGLIFRTPQIEDNNAKRVALSDDNIEDTASHKDLSIIDIDKLKKLLDSDDIINDYNKYCDESSERIAKLDIDKTLQFLKYLKELNSEKEYAKLIRSSGYREFSNEEELRKYIKARIDIYNEMIDKYQDMLEHNYKALKISSKEKDKLKKSLKIDKDEKLSKTLDKITLYLEKNKKLWLRSWGADFTKLNGGKVYMNPEENIWDFASNVRTLYNHSLKFDLIILCHGTNITPGKSLTQDEIKFVEKYKRLAEKYGGTLSKKELDELKNEFTLEDQSIINKYNKNLKKLLEYYSINITNDRYYYNECLYIKDLLLGKIKKQWGFDSPLKTEFGIYRDVNDLLRVCIANGYKKIQIMSCNPGGYEIANDIKKMENIIISYQKYSVLTESQYSYCDTLIESISFKNIGDKISNILKSFKEKSKQLISNIKNKIFNTVFIKIENKKAVEKQIINKSKLDTIKQYENCNKSIEKEISKLNDSLTKLNLLDTLLSSNELLKNNK